MAVATQEQAVVDRVPKGLYIGGEWRDASEGGTLAVEDGLLCGGHADTVSVPSSSLIATSME